MLIPSIDFMGGRIVQLVQGEKLKLAFDDFEYWIDRFSAYPLVQLIDLDAAMRQGRQHRADRTRSQSVCPARSAAAFAQRSRHKSLLDAGARRVILGSVLFNSRRRRNGRRSIPVKIDRARELCSQH